MYEFHKNRQWYYEMQTLNTEKYVIPFIEEKMPISSSTYVLEVGCGEGGVLKAFINKGCKGVGVDLDKGRIDLAKQFLEKEIAEDKIQFYSEDIYDSQFEELFAEKFDLIVLKDVIEHIPNQERILAQFKKYLKKGGYIYFGFPPFDMPYGGHQQVGTSWLFSKIPYTHLLPMPLYKLYMKLLGQRPDDFVEIKETGISTARFERICKDENYSFANSRFYLINPIYEYKFGLKPIVQFDFIRNVPYLRDFLTTCVYYLIRK